MEALAYKRNIAHIMMLIGWIQYISFKSTNQHRESLIAKMMSREQGELYRLWHEVHLAKCLISLQRPGHKGLMHSGKIL